MGANCMKLDFTDEWPNQSPEPTPIAAFGHSRTAVARHVVGSGWLSFLR
jgi:hypothetical protein